MHRRYVALFALGGATAGCGSYATEFDRTLPPGAVTRQTVALPDSVARHLYSGITQRRRVVVQDAATWTQLWNEATAQVQPRPAVPQVDFSRESIVVASMGTRTTGGYAIEIVSAYDNGSRRSVVVREVSPPHTCGITQALTAPVVAVRLPYHSGTVEFIETSQTRACP
jgi:hypothetical protein